MKKELIKIQKNAKNKYTNKPVMVEPVEHICWAGWFIFGRIELCVHRYLMTRSQLKPKLIDRVTAPVGSMTIYDSENLIVTDWNVSPKHIAECKQSVA